MSHETSNVQDTGSTRSPYWATYSPDDNKLRLYGPRLERDLYERVRAAGFIRAPKQELFVAPMWTPAREDLLIELCGEIGDEDTSLLERAEERAERFSGYSDSRNADAEAASSAPGFAGLSRAVKMWDTAKYWTSRAAGAVRHAKYKEQPTVRYRRIKRIEADKRAQERQLQKSRGYLERWQAEGLTHEAACEISIGEHIYRCFPQAEYPNSTYDGEVSLDRALEKNIITAEQARDIAVPLHAGGVAHCQRWINHYDNRLAYERAMLGEQGGVVAEGFDFKVGGQVCRRGSWYLIKRVNRQGGKVNSVSVAGHFASTVGLDEISDYRPPNEGDEEKVRQATKLPPMCNYPGEGFKHMTATEWRSKRMTDVPQSKRIEATQTHDVHRTRATYGGHWTAVSVYITDLKQVDPPLKTTVPAVATE